MKGDDDPPRDHRRVRCGPRASEAGFSRYRHHRRRNDACDPRERGYPRSGANRCAPITPSTLSKAFEALRSLRTAEQVAKVRGISVGSRQRLRRYVKMAKVKLTLAKSLIGRKKNQILTANSLGLKKIGDTVVSERDNILEGKLNVIAHLVKVEEAK